MEKEKFKLILVNDEVVECNGRELKYFIRDLKVKGYISLKSQMKQRGRLNNGNAK